MIQKNTSYFLIGILFLGYFSHLQGSGAIALLIDPSNPDSNKVKIFQETYMGILEGDSGYGSFGPKTTAKWQEIIYDHGTYENLYKEAVTFKEDSNFMDSNKFLHYLIDAPNCSNALKLKAKFMRSQLFYDLSLYAESVDYFKLLLSEDKSNELRKKSLFMIAYIYNNNLDMYTDALNYYNQFLLEYKNDELIPSVKFEVDQINDILERIKG